MRSAAFSLGPLVAIASVASATQDWSHFAGNGCDYTVMPDAVTWYRAARTCAELGDGAKLASVWSVAEAGHIASLRHGAPAWTFTYFEDNVWNVNLFDRQLWSPSEPKGPSSFAFCAQQADDEDSTLRFRAATCASEAAAICKKCPSVEHHFAAAPGPKAHPETKFEEVAGPRRGRRAASSTTTTTTTAEPEGNENQIGFVAAIPAGGTATAGAAAPGGAVAGSAILGAVCAIVALLLVAVTITLQKRRAAALREHMGEAAADYDTTMAEGDTLAEVVLEWDDDEFDVSVA